ncbi:MAG: amidohydrolase family protein [Steroidobacteraceae bacterium]
MQGRGGNGVTFVNGVIDGQLSTLRICGSRITDLHDAPHAGDRVVDLEGDRLLPGLINAHDHLQLNSLPPLEFSSSYRHVREWIADINERRRADPRFESQVNVPRATRLAVGGIKNLLSGVTSVAHHDPLYSCLMDPDFPTAVVAQYGWSHSLYIDGDVAVGNAYRQTPAAWPWIIHAAEGVDEEAATEWERLERLGCVAGNTRVVHGVALDTAARMRLAAAGAGLIWCPSSNLRLFGKTIKVTTLAQLGQVALGTDSRLSGSRDLLEELGLAAKIEGLNEPALEALVTSGAARLLGLADRGSLRSGLRADIVVLRRGVRLTHATRTDLRLVLRDGRPRYGDMDLARTVEPAVHWRSIRLDGFRKALDPVIAGMLEERGAIEPGLELSAATWAVA